MITAFNVPIWSQRDPRWSGQRLGTVDGATIGQYGCLITSLSMMNAGFDPNNPLTPNQVDDLFTNNKGYANGDLVVWNAINRLLPNCSLMAQDICNNSPAPIDKISHHLDIGGLVVVQVGFGGNPANMHYLLVVGYGAGPIFHDPWYGDQSNFESRRYGTGDASKDILAVHYFGDAISNEPIKPPVPVAARPSVPPFLGFQRKVRAGINVNYRKSPDPNGEVIQLFQADDVLDFKGFVHGTPVGDSDVWFVGKYSNGYIFSGAFDDNATHDLPDLTPQAPAPPTPAPVVETPPAPTPVVNDVQPPASTDWAGVLGWRPEPEKERTVTNPKGTDVVDLTTATLVTHLPVGTTIRHIAGAVTYQGTEWVRTQFSVDHGKWNAVKKEDLSSPTLAVPVKNELADDVFSDLTTLEEDFKGLNQSKPSLLTRLQEAVAILLSPVLKRITKKEK